MWAIHYCYCSYLLKWQHNTEITVQDLLDSICRPGIKRQALSAPSVCQTLLSCRCVKVILQLIQNLGVFFSGTVSSSVTSWSSSLLVSCHGFYNNSSIFFSISGHVRRPSLFKEGLWPEEKIKISSMSTSTLSIYMTTEPASSITRAATLLSSIFSLFFLLWLLPCNTAVWERSTSLLFFLLQALFIGYCVRGGYFLQSVVPCLVSWPATSY